MMVNVYMYVQISRMLVAMYMCCVFMTCIVADTACIDRLTSFFSFWIIIYDNVVAT